MNFITCNLIGPSKFEENANFGLANQMFQVATALSYAKDNKVNAVFPMIKNKDKFGNYIENIFSKLNTTEFDSDDYILEFHQPSFNFCKIPKTTKIRIHGYFQSEKFFIHNKEMIKEYFLPSKNLEIYINNKYSKILEDSLSLHFRFGDYTNLQKHHPMMLKTDYYEKVIEKNKRKNLLIFSDNVEVAKNINFLQRDNVTFIEGESEVTDLFIMSKCTDNAIANSSFSWWGAWLNENANKLVYYPKIWFGPKLKKFDTTDLFPESWKRVENKFKNRFFKK